MMLLKMAFKNMLRRRSRTLLVVLMIGLSLSGLLFLQGLYDGMLEQMVRSMIKSDAGQVVIYQKGFRLSERLKDSIDSPKDVMDIVQKNISGATVTSRLRVNGMINTGRSTSGTVIVGIDSDMEGNISNFKSGIVDGGYFEKKRREALIGVDLAEKLKLKIGQKIVISGQEMDGDIASASVRIKGFIRTYNPSFDKQGIVLDKGFMAKTFELNRSVSSIRVMLPETVTPEVAKDRLTDILPEDVEVMTWKELYPRIEYSQVSLDVYNGISYTIVFLVVALGIMDVLLISVLERMKEFGIMSAIGTGSGHMVMLIVLESLVVGGLGLLFGIGAGFSILQFFHQTGVDLSVFSKGLEMFGIASVIYPVVQLSYIWMATASVAIASVCSAIFPVWIFIRKKPVEMIRYH